MAGRSSTGSGAYSGRGEVTRPPITRIFVDAILEPGEKLKLPKDEARHVATVLRARRGDILEVSDADGHLFVAEFVTGGEAEVLEELRAPPEEAEVTLYQAVPKGGRMDLVVEKATEVGVTRIVPLSTDHGLIKAGANKTERWRRVAGAAARQSLRLRVPDVSDPVAFGDAAREAGKGGILLHNAEGLLPLESVVSDSVGLFVGPEGGWSTDEMRLAKAEGLAFAQLGLTRLRSETAGIVGVARARAALERSSGR